MLDQEIRNFLNYQKETLDYAPNTQAAYEGDLKGFAAYCRQEGRTGLPNKTVLRSYLLKLELEGKSAATIARTIVTLHAFSRYLILRGLQKEDVSAGLAANAARLAQETAKKAPECLSVQEVEKLLAAPDCNTGKGLRDRAMLELSYSSGVRVSELLGLKRFDLNERYRFLTVKGENGRERVVPYGSYAAEALAGYLNGRDPVSPGGEEELLFPNKNGLMMSRQGFFKIFREYAALAGIRTDIGPQILRDSCAKHMLQNGAGVSEVAGLLGVSESMVLKYLEDSGERHIIEVYKKSHPRA